MPLEYGKSDDARKRNVAREIASGKKPKQTVAIAYSEQRRAGGGKKPTGRGKKK